MTLYAPIAGKRQTYKQRAVGTSYVTLVPAMDTVWTLDSVNAANIVAGSADFTLEIYDGANATILVPAITVTTKARYAFNDHHIHLEPGEILRVKSSVLVSFDVTAVGFQGMPAR